MRLLFSWCSWGSMAMARFTCWPGVWRSVAMPSWIAFQLHVLLTRAGLLNLGKVEVDAIGE